MSIRARRAAMLGTFAVGLLAMYLLLRLGGGTPVPAPAGLPDPGPVTGWALPVLTFVSVALGVLVVGALLVPVISAPTGTGELGGRAFRAVWSVRYLALLWAVVALAEVVFTYSDQFAVPIRQARWIEVSGFAQQIDQGQALLVQAALAAAVAIASRWVLTVREASVLLMLAITAFLPPVFTGHSAAAGSHDTAVVSLLLHVLAVAVWCGGIVALWWHLGSASTLRATAARRFSVVAAWCFGITAVSGVVNALVRLGSIRAFVTSDYGRGALVKLVLLGLIGLVAVRARRIALGHAQASGRGWADLSVLTGFELVILSTAIGLGVGLSRTPPPVGDVYTSAAEGLLGGPVPPPPGLRELLVSFTPSGIGLAIVGVGGVAYAVGALTLRRREVRWSVLRTVSWYVGLALVGYATFGGLGTYSHVMFSAHMAAHMILSMVAPILLVLGAPITLALRALPGADTPGGRGPRHWLAAALRSWPVRFVTSPIVAALVFVSSLYAIYFTGLFENLMENHLGHAFMELHFLIAGCLFFEVLVGDAPVPRRLSHLARLGLLLLVVPFHAFFAIAVMNQTTVIGGDYYRLLDRGYRTGLLADQYLAGSLTWAMGEVPMVLVLVVLVAQWYGSDRRDAQRHDRRSDRDGDAELAAYNQMFGDLTGRERERS